MHYYIIFNICYGFLLKQLNIKSFSVQKNIHTKTKCKTTQEQIVNNFLCFVFYKKRININ